jgi:LuxR family maltose regulon positive regulatory protein
VDDLLSTKFLIPKPHSNLISRPHLTTRILSGMERKVTLIAAPAGFGKTSLMSECIPKSTRCVTWLSLDRADNDPARFWSYVIASIQQIDQNLGLDALTNLRTPFPPPIDFLLNSLINDISQFPDTFATVLDDYHVIRSTAIHNALTYFIGHAPANLHLIIITRADPPIPLSRLRADGRLSEIRAKDLRFTPEECNQFLTELMGLSMEKNEIAAVEARTEGWIAGLKMAALSMQEQEDLPEFIRTFSGSHRHILGYLAEEVLNQRPKGTLEFLLQTSILDRLCAPLCDAVTGSNSSQTFLEQLNRANLFIMPLDEEGKWFRYHQLFADVLQARLLRVHPERVDELHARASAWHEREGNWPEAVDHSLASRNHTQAARQMELAASDWFRSGKSAQLRTWVRSLPDADLNGRFELATYVGWGYALAAEMTQSQAWLERAQAATSPEASPASRGRLLGLAARLAEASDDEEQALQLARNGLDLLGDTDPLFRSLILRTLARALEANGDGDGTIIALQEAVSESRKAGQPMGVIVASTYLGLKLYLGGRRLEALTLCRRLLGEFVEGRRQPLPATGLIYYLLAVLLYEENDLAGAQAAYEQAYALTRSLRLVVVDLYLKQVKSKLETANGDLHAALETVLLGHNEAVQANLPHAISDFLATEANLRLKLGDLVGASQWAQNVDLPPVDKLNLSLDQTYLVFARLLLAQGRHDKALALLGDLEGFFTSANRWGSMISVHVLRARACREQGQTALTMEAFEKALRLAEPGGYIRSFVDEGEAIRALITEYRSAVDEGERTSDKDRLIAYADELAAAFAPESTRPKQQADLVEPLTSREFEILQLMSEGLSNREIAVGLVLAISTVKSHINHLYGKLGTHRRTQAVSVARDLGLLGD